ncbi:hypothetical protein JKA74_03435 [Marivirga sp. S37H4]|uniref:Lipoprotein n=1 Tax=Marivirga aurantiaca TaxID=2802615 RepID=A0A934WVZ8_9BACT|nr:hypothetical protein [Marivirga aurantiaca]MBK6264078.1 hypothetical protein [Marivirga aurantiaca]
MKKLMMIFCATGFLISVACDNNTRGTRNDNATDQTDTTGVYDENADDPEYDRNRFGADRGRDNTGAETDRRVADENIPDDYGDNPNQTEGSINDLPREVREKLENDEAFQNMKLHSSRSYTRNGNTYYEITLEETGTTTDRRNTNNP